MDWLLFNQSIRMVYKFITTKALLPRAACHANTLARERQTYSTCTGIREQIDTARRRVPAVRCLSATGNRVGRPSISANQIDEKQTLFCFSLVLLDGGTRRRETATCLKPTPRASRCAEHRLVNYICRSPYLQNAFLRS
jgi:hypothetical protein